MKQPALHDLTVAVHAPTVLLASASGDIEPRDADGQPTAQGVLHADVRALALLRLSVDSRPEGAAVRVSRDRRVAAGELRERVLLASSAVEPVEVTVRFEVGTDLATVQDVRSGRALPLLPPQAADDAVTWSTSGTRVRAGGEGAVPELAPASASLAWTVRLAPGEATERTLVVQVEDTGSIVGPAPSSPSWAVPEVAAGDGRFAPWVDRSLEDLDGLRMTLTDRPDDVFLAAGAPWYFTLFGRDSLWTARMLLPLGTGLAGGTLRALAAYQGRRDDAVTQEQPGKILHELRRAAFELDSSTQQAAGDDALLSLPPLYYGTVDATALWVCLLHDAWLWGLPDGEVAALLPALEAALAWIGRAAEDGGGFLRYIDRTGTGLANQGWKDSPDAVRFADGARAEPPVALVEVQGYAHEAAVGGARLLEAFGRPGADRWRRFAGDLAARFRSAFWVSDGDGRFPALALDGSGRPVDSPTSNIGHLLTSGLLDAAETDAVVERLGHPSLAAGFGLRTMASTVKAFEPLSYHCGSIWPHDTAIAIQGLARVGRFDVATPLLDGLLAVAQSSGGQLAELWSGEPREAGGPAPYVTACRPQAWSAAASVTALASLLGIEPDVPAGRLTVRPARPSPVGAVRTRGLVVAGQRLDVETDASGGVVAIRCDAGLRVETS